MTIQQDMADKMRPLIESLLLVASEANNRNQYRMSELAYAFSTALGCICTVDHPVEHTLPTKPDGVVN